ncbi:MAG: hypothetical protein ACI4UY_08060 [Kiritimatiellia bacterium]
MAGSFVQAWRLPGSTGGEGRQVCVTGGKVSPVNAAHLTTSRLK